MMPLYVAFFNLIFNSGVLPVSILEGAIRPIYKNKGDSKSPENYKTITILSCFGKLFTSILNARLNKFLDAHNILEEYQAGFPRRLLNNGSYFCFACIIRNCKT